MAATYYTLLTKIGQASIANAVALNQPVNLTSMAVGDGNGNPTTPNENQTALVREKFRAQINQLTVDPSNPNYLIAELIIPTTVGGWSIYEVGVFDDQNQLVAVANFPATYKPELAEGSGRDLIVRIVIQVSNTSVVTLKVDPAIILASQAWVAANYVKKTTVAGGTTGQILAKSSNANEAFKWVDPTAAVDVNVFSREETQTIASGQTVVNLAQITTDGAAVYVEGIRLRDNQFTVNSSTKLTLATTYPNGSKVTVVQNEETSRNAFMLKDNNLSDLSSISVALSNLGLIQAVENILINGAFNVNQRKFTSGGTLAAAAYGHDRWKAGTSGCSYTFGSVADGITITAGSLQQIVESVNNPGGSLTLTWEGTAQARINGGNYSVSPLTVNGVTGATNLTVEFGTGTVIRAQLSPGVLPFRFKRRSFADELICCQRYFQYSEFGTVGTYSGAGGESHTYWFMKVSMRSSPTVTLVGGVGITYRSTTEFVDVYQSTDNTNHYAIIKEITLSAEL